VKLFITFLAIYTRRLGTLFEELQLDTNFGELIGLDAPSPRQPSTAGGPATGRGPKDPRPLSRSQLDRKTTRAPDDDDAKDEEVFAGVLIDIHSPKSPQPQPVPLPLVNRTGVV
jgi:hypothetical protein